jgi:DNA mismatch endonuclease (patch repair protein)
MTRSELMARIRSKRTGPERALASALAGMGWRGYRLWDATLPGRPDVVLLAERIAIQVNSCFFHRCPAHYRPPRTHVAFWDAKTLRNRARDRRTSRALRRMGYRVLTWWTHEALGSFLARLRRCATAAGPKARGAATTTRRS